ncbi:hypothetical protein D3C76_409440 [compost metagenome]
MANDELDAIVDDFVGDSHGLFRIARVVVFLGFEHLAVNAALGVDLLDGHFCTDELHITVLGHWTGFRAGDANLDGVGCERMAGNPGQYHCGKQLGNLLSSLVH